MKIFKKSFEATRNKIHWYNINDQRKYLVYYKIFKEIMFDYINTMLQFFKSIKKMQSVLLFYKKIGITYYTNIPEYNFFWYLFLLKIFILYQIGPFPTLHVEFLNKDK